MATRTPRLSHAPAPAFLFVSLALTVHVATRPHPSTAVNPQQQPPQRRPINPPAAPCPTRQARCLVPLREQGARISVSSVGVRHSVGRRTCRAVANRAYARARSGSCAWRARPTGEQRQKSRVRRCIQANLTPSHHRQGVATEKPRLCYHRHTRVVPPRPARAEPRALTPALTALRSFARQITAGSPVSCRA